MSYMSNKQIDLDEARDRCGIDPEPEPELQVIWIPCGDFAYEDLRDAAAGDVWGERRD